MRWKKAARKAVLEDYKEHLAMARSERQMELRHQMYLKRTFFINLFVFDYYSIKFVYLNYLFRMIDCYEIKKVILASLEQQKQLKADLELMQLSYEKLLIKNRIEENRARDEK